MQCVTSIERLARQEVVSQGRPEDVIDVLKVRFGTVLAAVFEAIGGIQDLAGLKMLHRKAIIIQSVEEFKALLTDRRV